MILLLVFYFILQGQFVSQAALAGPSSDHRIDYSPAQLDSLAQELRPFLALNAEGFGNWKVLDVAHRYDFNTDGFVIVINEPNNQGQCCVCGFLQQAGKAEMLAGSACIQYEKEVYDPLASFTMPVRREEQFEIRSCSSECKPDRVRAYWIPLR